MFQKVVLEHLPYFVASMFVYLHYYCVLCMTSGLRFGSRKQKQRKKPHLVFSVDFDFGL